MSVTAKSLGIGRPSVEDRLALVEEIWDGIRDEEAVAEFDDAFLAELERRFADAEAHPERLVPWETIRAEAVARMNSR